MLSEIQIKKKIDSLSNKLNLGNFQNVIIKVAKYQHQLALLIVEYMQIIFI